MKNKHKFFTWELLSKHRVYLMAFAIIWVVVYHGTAMGLKLPDGAEAINVIFRRGYAGVDIFLFLSGIGLYYSYKKTPDFRRFYKKRLMRVLLPYLFIGGTFWVCTDLGMKRDFLLFLKDMSLLSFWKDGTTRVWYIALILLLYALFPLIWAFVYRKESVVCGRIGVLIIGVVCVNAAVSVCFPEWYDKVEIALTRIPVFLIGIGTAQRVWEKRAIRAGEILLLIVLLCLKIPMHFYGIKGVYQRYWCAVLAISICLGLSVLCEVCDRNKMLCKLKGMLVPIGTWSLELYIVHVWVRRFLMKSDFSFVIGEYDLNQYGVVGFLLLVMISAFLTWLAVLVEKRVLYNKK